MHFDGHRLRLCPSYCPPSHAKATTGVGGWAEGEARCPSCSLRRTRRPPPESGNGRRAKPDAHREGKPQCPSAMPCRSGRLAFDGHRLRLCPSYDAMPVWARWIRWASRAALPLLRGQGPHHVAASHSWTRRTASGTAAVTSGERSSLNSWSRPGSTSTPTTQMSSGSAA
jgi:hypothetical protein